MPRSGSGFPTDAGSSRHRKLVAARPTQGRSLFTVYEQQNYVMAGNVEVLDNAEG